MFENLFLLQITRAVHIWDLIAGDAGNISRTALENLKMEAYMGGAVMMLIFLAIAILIAFLIPYEPGKNPRDPQKRRMWMIIMGVLVLVVLFVISLLATRTLSGRQADIIQQATLISVAVNTILYFGLAFVLSKVARKSKLGTWFPSKK
ncbi:MAG: hypothetical protein KDE26_15375 [Bacteroidetes bacterium]|nr:hypothetical protein [Bacteroidota bacterium]MCB0844634.1 hypothetical protein [Bacteroidota bacterium]